MAPNSEAAAIRQDPSFPLGRGGVNRVLILYFFPSATLLGPCGDLGKEEKPMNALTLKHSVKKINPTASCPNQFADYTAGK